MVANNNKKRRRKGTNMELDMVGDMEVDAIDVGINVEI